MPAWNYHIRNKVNGLDFKGYVYAETLKLATKEAEDRRRVFGKSTRLVSVERVAIKMVKPGGLANMEEPPARKKLKAKQAKKHKRRRR